MPLSPLHDQTKQCILDYHREVDQTKKQPYLMRIRALIAEQLSDTPMLSFAGLDLDGLDLSGLPLNGCDFSEAISIKSTNFRACKLRAASFAGRDRFHRTNLSGANFAGADCTEADFSNTDLRGCDFNDATVVDICLTHAWLDRPILRLFIKLARSLPDSPPTLSLNDISLEDIDCSSINFSDCYLHRVYFARTKLKSTRFGNADVYGAYFAKAYDFDPSTLRQCANKKNCQLSQLQQVKKRKYAPALKDTKEITHFFKPATDKHVSKEAPSKRRRLAS